VFIFGLRHSSVGRRASIDGLLRALPALSQLIAQALDVIDDEFPVAWREAGDPGGDAHRLIGRFD